MALMARQGAEVKVLLKNGFPNLIEAPSVGKGGGEFAPQESWGKKTPLLQQFPAEVVALGMWDIQWCLPG